MGFEVIIYRKMSVEELSRGLLVGGNSQRGICPGRIVLFPTNSTFFLTKVLTITFTLVLMFATACFIFRVFVLLFTQCRMVFS